jgi:hypothetical protein
MTQIHARAFSRRTSRPSYRTIRPSLFEKAQGRPDADRTRGPRATRSTRQNHRYEPNVRPSLRNGFTAYTCSPRCTGLFGHRRPHIIIANLASASGCQDHTISPSYQSRSSAREPRAATPTGHRIPRPTFVTIAKRPS